jgi:hypothetical protein
MYCEMLVPVYRITLCYKTEGYNEFYICVCFIVLSAYVIKVVT